MRFLCLPGAYGSAKNFEVQLAPFCKEMSLDGTTEFFFTQGSIKCNPPSGFLDYFGPAPHYRFIEYDGIEQNDVLERVRDFPEGENPEEVLRELMPEGSEGIRSSVRAALDALYDTIEKHGPFDGICAYSEGTVVGSTLIMDERRRFENEGRPRSIKRAVFFAGWPPLNPERNEMLLADISEQVVDVPTLHCIGADDPYLHGAMALFNVCEQDEAILFDHGKGHTIPRDAQTLRELGDAVRGLGKACF
ncbi:serine hydrolase FSH [Leptodontidium sp. 2 PMI_412]|nr:serine hydrolase FSH [Leptodontidium sp. 2 PMI_412]